MKSTKIRPAINIFNVSKTVTRTISVNSAPQNTEKVNTLKSWSEIPGPKSFPIIGPLHNFLPGGIFHNKVGSELFDHLHKTYGPIVKLEGSFGRPSLTFLYDAENVSQVLRGENWMPERPGLDTLTYYRQVYKKEKLGSKQRLAGLMTDDGEKWKEFRTSVNPIMLPPKTVKLYEKIIVEVASDMVERLRSKRDENNMIKEKFDDEMNLWSLESIAVVALGGRLNCLDPNLPEDSLEKKLIRCVHDIFDAANELENKISVWKYFPTRTFKKAMQVYEEQENICKQFIRKAKDNFQICDGEKSILQKLMEVNEEIAVVMASDMLFAGVDTVSNKTSNTMTATLFLLAKNPEVQEKLRKEVLEGKERKFLKACLRESFRVLPVVAGNMRKVTKEYHILGYRIPKDTRIVLGHQCMSSMEEYFPRAKEFIPERWLVEKDHPLYYRKAHPFAYNPFGFGVRLCIGRRIAELELESFLTKLMENFRVEWIGPDLRVDPLALNYMRGPYGFKFTDFK